MDVRERHLRLLTETIAAVNSTLDLEEVLGLVARKVADVLDADACFVYLYDERSDELVLRATHGTNVEEMTKRPRMRPGEGITGTAAAEGAPIMIAAQAHLDPRFKLFSNLPEDQYESILAVPIVARERLAGALNVRTIAPREFFTVGGEPVRTARGDGSRPQRDSRLPLPGTYPAEPQVPEHGRVKKTPIPLFKAAAIRPTNVVT